MDTVRLSLLFLFMTAVTNTSFAEQGDNGEREHRLSMNVTTFQCQDFCRQNHERIDKVERIAR